MTPININKKEIDGITIFEFSGAIDESNADITFKNIFNEFFGNKLIFDIGGLTFANSKFMGYLSKMFEFIEEKKGYFYLVNLQEPLKDFLENIGIVQIIPVAINQDEAIRIIKEKNG